MHPQSFLATAVLLACGHASNADSPSVARRWNEATLNAISLSPWRVPLQARNLFHASAAMFDAWAAYDNLAAQYLVCEKVTAPRGRSIESAREEAISFAVYRVLQNRYSGGVNGPAIQASLTALMIELGYDPAFVSVVGDSPAALGNRIGAAMVGHGISDGSNQAQGYASTFEYKPLNDGLIVSYSYGLDSCVTEVGVPPANPDRWQPLAFDFMILQSNPPIIAPSAMQFFFGPHWGEVAPFALGPEERSGEGRYLDPGPPPKLADADNREFIAALVDIIKRNAALDAGNRTIIDVSPGTIGNNPLGADIGTGHATNPVTGERYRANPTLEFDYARVLSEYWSDVPGTFGPSGYWNALANAVSDHPLTGKRIGGVGREVNALEWDVCMYFALNGALHDAAIAAWSVKHSHDLARPITLIRHMATLGQSSDPRAPHYHPHALPIVEGVIELITEADVLPGGRFESLVQPAVCMAEPLLDGKGNPVLVTHVGEMAIRGWKGQPANPAREMAGVDWILGSKWTPYQKKLFLSPSSPGYVSGRSAIARAAAETLTAFTGDGFFPGGIKDELAEQGTFLAVEGGPSATTHLQWATYFDAADSAGVSARDGGISREFDDYAGRVMGATVGAVAWQNAQAHFKGLAQPLLALTGDLNCDALIDAADLAILLGAWGGSGPGDLDGDGVVGAADLAILLGAWS